MTTTNKHTLKPKRLPRASVWHNRDYVLLWCGQAISAVGSSVSELAFPLLVLAITGSPFQAGIVATLNTLPASLFSLLSGVLVDRWNRKGVMLFCEVGRTLSLASIPVALMLGHLTVYQLYINALLEGTLAILFGLAYTSSLGEIVSREHLSSAFAQEELLEGTTALCGPSLSGLLFSLSHMLPFVTDAISYIVSIIGLLLIRTPFQGERVSKRSHLLAEIQVGMSWLWHQPFLRSMTLLMALATFCAGAKTLTIIVLAQQRGASPLIIGLIFAIGGVGTIVGSLLSPCWEKRLQVGQAIILCRWLSVLLWPLYILMPLPILMGLVEFGFGFIDPIEDVPYFSYRLRLIPEALRGRVIGSTRLFPGLTRPLGRLLMSMILQWFGPIAALLVSWSGILLLALLMTGNRHIAGAKRSAGTSI